MTALFREEPYTARCQARVTAVDERGIQLDRTVFYPLGGGQPGDTGRLRWEGGEIAIVDARKGEAPDSVLHLPAGPCPLQPGTIAEAEIDWPRRHRLMRMHTCLHLLCAVVPGQVTGGQIGAEKSRLDFDVPGDSLDRDAIETALNRLIAEGRAVTTRWITAAELEARPELVRTMSVKPPTASGSVRLVEIEGTDLQPCGGTHVANTAEIGRVAVAKIENKGRQNRRITVALAE